MGHHLHAHRLRVLLHDELEGGAPRDQRREFSVARLRSVAGAHCRVEGAGKRHLPRARGMQRGDERGMPGLQQLQQPPHEKVGMPHLGRAASRPARRVGVERRRRVILIHQQGHDAALLQRQRRGQPDDARADHDRGLYAGRGCSVAHYV